MKHWTALIACAWLLVFSAAVDAQTEPIPYKEYQSLIGQMRGDALNAQSRQGDNCNAQLISLANQLNSITEILMPDGSVMTVDHAQAGLPFNFPYCNPVNFISFLNGICPSKVCLTSGVVQAPSETRVNDAGEDVTLVGLVDFTNSETLPQSVPPELPTGSATSEGVNGGGTVVATSEGASGETATSELAGDFEEGGEATSEEASGDTATGETVTGEATSEGASDEAAAGEGGTDGVNNEGETSEGVSGETAVPTPTEQGNALGEGDEDDGLGETAVVEPTAEQSRPIWLYIVIGILTFIFIIGVILYVRRRNKEPMLRPETVKKVEENVQSGRRLLSEGEYREAIHKLFNATLRILEDRHLIRFEQTYTNYELLEATTTAPRLVTHLAPVVDAYDRVWYGSEPLATAEFEALVDQIEHLKSVQRT